MPPTPTPARDRLHPVAALRALRALIRDPDDTARVFDVIDALSGPTRGRLLGRFRREASGRRLLEERPDLLATLSDRARLAALPAGTLGRCYAEFMAREQISADEMRWFADRLRDMHDLWHVVTGYERDLIGEASLLAFTWAQTRNPGIALIVATAYWRAGREAPGMRPLLREGVRRGRRAAWLPAQRWEDLLEQPLAQVREALRVGEPPVYEQLRSDGAPALA
jgi:ubiquinone biosynthesis protein COQ4